MKVSLRKANALQEALAEAIKSAPKSDSEVDVLNHEMWFEEINNAQSRYFDEIRNKLKLVEARFSIRTKILHHNNLSGVSELLTELAEIDSKIITIQRWIVQKPIRQQDGILVKKRTRKVAQIERADYDGYEEMDVSVIGKGDREHWEGIVKELRRKKASINDRLLELNIKTEIELSSQVEAVLRKENLI